jgi:hypothetical protein
VIRGVSLYSVHYVGCVCYQTTKRQIIIVKDTFHMSSTRQATAQIGGVPTVGVDVPICAVFLAIFVALATTHMTILQTNRKRGHKFLFNGLCFGFSMSRIAACVFRIAWATRPRNADISLVAAVFLNAGILLIYIINNLLAWRMVRSAEPHIGWRPAFRIANKAFLWPILGLIVPLIVTIVLRVKRPTLAHIQTANKVLSRLAQTYFLIISLTAAVLLAVAAYTAQKSGGPKDPFGSGSWNTKLFILVASVVLATVEAGFRCGTTWPPARLATNAAWWDTKAAFYCFNFTIDVCILTLFAAGRIDQRLHVPNGANGPMSYSASPNSFSEASQRDKEAEAGSHK